MPSLDDPAAFARLAADLQAERDEDVTAQTIVDRLLALVGEAEAVSLTLRVRGGDHKTLASTHPWAREADAAQYAADEGPCVEVADGTGWLRSGDVATDPRWPAWGVAAAGLGVGSLLAVQLLEGDDPIGALNLYSAGRGRFADRDTIDLVLLYATHAAHALTSARLVTNLQTALGSRHTIGMAQGIVMERFGLDEQRSFELLQRLSSTSERKLRDVASHIVQTRDLPGTIT